MSHAKALSRKDRFLNHQGHEEHKAGLNYDRIELHIFFVIFVSFVVTFSPLLLGAFA